MGEEAQVFDRSSLSARQVGTLAIRITCTHVRARSSYVCARCLFPT